MNKVVDFMTQNHSQNIVHCWWCSLKISEYWQSKSHQQENQAHFWASEFSINWCWEVFFTSLHSEKNFTWLNGVEPIWFYNLIVRVCIWVIKVIINVAELSALFQWKLLTKTRHKNVYKIKWNKKAQ